MVTFRDSVSDVIRLSILKAPESKKRELEEVVQQAGGSPVLAEQLWNGAGVQKLDDGLILKLLQLFGCFTEDVCIDLYADRFQGLSKRSVKSDLNVICKYARKVSQKPIWEFNRDELLMTMMNSGVSARERVSSLYGRVRRFVMWMHDCGVDTALYQSVKDEEVTSFRQDVPRGRAIQNQYIKNPEELTLVLSGLWDLYGIHVGCVLAVFAYIGFDMADALLLKDSEVEIRSRCLVIQDREYRLPPKLCNMIRSYATEEKAIVVEERGWERVYHVVPSPYFIKQYDRGSVCARPNEPLSPQRARAYITRLCRSQQCDDSEKFDISWSGLRTSGAFYRLLERQEQGKVITIDSIKEECGITSYTASLNKLNDFREFARIYKA